MACGISCSDFDDPTIPDLGICCGKSVAVSCEEPAVPALSTATANTEERPFFTIN